MRFTFFTLVLGVSVILASCGGSYTGKSSVMTGTSGSYKETATTAADASVSDESPAAGKLTSGEINDFSKWEMWNDLSTGQFSTFSKQWMFFAKNRFVAEVKNNDGFPVCDATVMLLDKEGKLAWQARTDNTGKAELWTGMFRGEIESTDGYSIRVDYKGQSKTIPNVKAFPDGINRTSFNADCGAPKNLDIVFTMDATGSMGDEIAYLKTELLDITRKVKTNKSDLNVRVGTVFYRDYKDDYLTRVSPLNGDVEKTYSFVQDQAADGGDDYPEAVDEALRITAEKMNWSDEAVARIVFLILDAPPHETEASNKKLHQAIKDAAKKGIRIIPITCSGVDKSTEFLMRSIALATNGTYTFLTDHSGIGDKHIAPSTDDYKVEKMNDLVMRLIMQYSYYPDCKTFTAPEPKKEQVREPEQVVASIEKSEANNLNAPENGIAKEEIHSIPQAPPAPKQVENREQVIEETVKSFTVEDETAENGKHDLLTEPLATEEFADNVKIYPNPTVGQVTLEVKGADIKELYLTDISGKVLERYVVQQGQKTQINIGDYSAGIYFIRYEKNDHWKAGKVILQKN